MKDEIVGRAVEAGGEPGEYLPEGLGDGRDIWLRRATEICLMLRDKVNEHATCQQAGQPEGTFDGITAAQFFFSLRFGE